MKDFIKRISIAIISWLLLWYILYLFLWWTIIVQGEFIDSNYLVYWILLIVCLFFFILFGLHPVTIKATKATLFVIWIWLIILSNRVLLNNIDEWIYIWDIFIILWVIVTVLSPTKILITNKIQKKKDNSKMQVIEV
jgi:hypothetical protein